jgi:protein TonB
MKRIILLSIVVFFFFYNATAQVATTADSLSLHKIKDTIPAPPQIKTGNDDDNQVFTRLEQEATFPGGLSGWRDYLIKNLRADVPVKKGAPVGTYQVLVRFIVAKDGSISSIEAATHYGYGMEEEVIRIIKKGPKWTPGLQNGREVNSYRVQPVTFVIENQ